jgi:hypothetical protein
MRLVEHSNSNSIARVPFCNEISLHIQEHSSHRRIFVEIRGYVIRQSLAASFIRHVTI